MGMSFSTVEEKKQVRWFVMRAYKNEKMAEDRLKDKEYGLEYFIPKHYAVKTYHGMKSTRLVPVIPSLVFVHASHSQITEFKKRYNFLQFAMWKKSTGMEYITVPDDQMDSFIQIASLYEKDTAYYKPDEIDVFLDCKLFTGIFALCSLCGYRHSPDSADRFSQTAVRPSR